MPLLVFYSLHNCNYRDIVILSVKVVDLQERAPIFCLLHILCFPLPHHLSWGAGSLFCRLAYSSNLAYWMWLPVEPQVIFLVQLISLWLFALLKCFFSSLLVEFHHLLQKLIPNHLVSTFLFSFMLFHVKAAKSDLKPVSLSSIKHIADLEHPLLSLISLFF